MEYINIFSLIAITHILALASPGVDFTLVLKQSIFSGRRLGVWTALGIAMGVGFHATYSLAGLGWIIKSYPRFIPMIYIGGGLYLSWLGSQALWNAKITSDSGSTFKSEKQHNKIMTPKQAFLQGLLTNILNPKAAIFFISLFSSIIQDNHPFLFKAVLCAWLIIITAIWFSCVAYILTKKSIREKFLSYSLWIERCLGIVILFLGMYMILLGLE
jgi:RhtB (resistance to homoserine/threonine) family protein